MVNLLQLTSRALCCWDIYSRLPTAAAKFIIKWSLFLLKFKDAGPLALYS